MARIGVISISDGRDYVHDGIAEFIRTNEDRLVAEVTFAGHEVVSRLSTGQYQYPGRLGGPRVATAGSRFDRAALPGLGLPPFHDARAGSHPGTVAVRFPTSIRSSRAWSGCSPPAAGSTRSADATSACGATSRTPVAGARLGAQLRAATAVSSLARLDVRPYRRALDGHVHRGLRHR